MKKKIFLLYPYYFPHYRAGGPVQSIYNLAGCLNVERQFYFVSLARDIDGSPADSPVLLNAWQLGPQGENIFYTPSISFLLLFQLLKEIKPDVIFVNGLFNASTTLPGVFFAKVMKIKLVVSPRGMLQSWALGQKRTFLKKLYIRFLKMLLSKRAVVWHATDEQERKDILENFGFDQSIHIASNVPRQVKPFTSIEFPSKDNKIKLVFLSLINPNKNLHVVIDAVKQNQTFSLDIYGPVANEPYWKICKQKMEGISTIEYHGAVPPWDISKILKDYHFLVLPTQGENFGHAIFDALASSVPVIISKNTPWVDVENNVAGFYVDANNDESINLVFNHIANMDKKEYESFRRNSFAYAKNFLNKRDFFNEYKFLLQ